MSFKENIRAHKAVNDLLTLVEDAADPWLLGCDADAFWSAFWKQLAQQVVSKTHYQLVDRERYQPFTDAEAKKYEEKIVPFGKYEGERVRDVDPEYWSYITESDFNLNLVRYLRSRYYRKKHGLPVL